MLKLLKHKWLERNLILIMGLLLGYIYTINMSTEKFTFFESLAFSFGKVSYMRGCVENASKGTDCMKGLISFKQDNIDISNNFNKIVQEKHL